MATVYSDVRTSTTQNDPSEFVKANQLGGTVRIAYATYTTAATASGDVIELFALPHGARVVGGSMYWDSLGASTTVSIGHGAYTDADGNAVVAAAAFFKGATSTSGSNGGADIAPSLNLGAGHEVSLDASTDNEFVVTATIGGAAATGPLEVSISYVVA